MRQLGGSWEPANAGTSVVRLIFTFQAALRGSDYFAGRSDGGDAHVFAAPLAVWGGLFYGCAIVVILGFAGRWVGALVLGHALLAGLYMGLGVSVLANLPGGIDPGGAAALVIAAVGLYLLLAPQTGVPLRLALAVPLMVAGQLGLAAALGSGYRLGTGLVLSGAVHAVFAAATLTGWKRQQLAGVVEQGG